MRHGCRPLVVTFGLVLSLAAVARPAAADVSTFSDIVPVANVAGLVADSHGHVFVTGGLVNPNLQIGNEVWVFDVDGHYQTEITGEPTASGLALSSDGETLYVADAGASRISAVSTTTLTEVAQYATPPGSCPTSIAVVGSNIWFSDSCDGSASATIGAVSTVGGAAKLLATPTFNQPLLRAVAGDPTSLIVGERSLRIAQQWATRVTKVDIASAPFVVTSVVVGSPQNYLQDLAVTGDGAEVVIASPARPGVVNVLRTSDLAQDGTYTSDLYESAVAAASGSTGLVAVGVNLAAASVAVYQQGQPQPIAQLAGPPVVDNGLAWSPDGNHLYAVTGYDQGNKYLQVMTTPGHPQTVITVTGQSPLKQGVTTQLTGTLTRQGVPVAGESLQVFRQGEYDANPGHIADVVTDPSGSFSFSTLWPTGPSTTPVTQTYTFVEPGAAGALTAAGTFVVTISGPDPPGPPTTVEILAGRGSVCLYFKPPVPAPPVAVRSYVVYRGTSPSTLSPAPGTAPTGDATYWCDSDPVIGARDYYALAAVNPGGQGPLSEVVSAVPWTSTTVGTFVPIGPVRLFDSRTRHAGLAPQGVLTMGTAGLVPSDATALVLNLTATAATASTYLSVYPTGQPRPATSAVNVVPGQTVANLVTVAAGSQGQVDIYNAYGRVQVIADLEGFYTDANMLAGQGAFHSVTPQRVADTRIAGGPLTAHEVRAFSYPVSADLETHVLAVLLSVTETAPQAAGYLTVSGGYAEPGTSNLNFARGQTISNTVLARASTSGTGTVPFWVTNGSAGSTQVVIDLVGWYDDLSLPGGLRFHPITPTRIVDSRVGLGLAPPLGSAGQAAVTLPGTIGTAYTAAVVMNVTAVAPTRNTFLSLWPDGLTRPLSSFLNPAAGSITAGMVTTGISPLTRAFDIYNLTGTTQVVADVAGYFDGTLPLGSS